MGNTLRKENRALITFEGRIGGDTYEKSKPFPGGTTREVMPLIIGSNTFIGAGKDLTTNKKYQGFEQQLIGMAEGESRIIEVIFPQDYHESTLSGKPTFFKVDLVKFT